MNQLCENMTPLPSRMSRAEALEAMVSLRPAQRKDAPPALEIIQKIREEHVSPSSTRRLRTQSTPASGAEKSASLVPTRVVSGPGFSYKAIYEGSGFAALFQSSSDASKCVIQIPSFEADLEKDCDPSSSDRVYEACVLTNLRHVYEDLSSSVTAASSAGCQYIGIDLVSNGGGYVCFGVVAASFLVPSLPMKNAYDMDLIISKWIKSKTDFCDANTDLRESCGSGGYLSKKTGRPYTSSDELFGSGSVSYTRGQYTSRYTPKFMDDCSLFTKYATPYRPKLFYPQSRIVILADGLCGSTCRQFTELLHQTTSVKVAALGGIYNAAMDASSFAGGNVLDSNATFTEFSALATLGWRERNLAPSQFLTSAKLTYNYREAYSFIAPQTTLEFYFSPADYRVASWPSPTDDNVDDTASPWSSYSDFFKVAFGASPDPKASGQKCETGTSIPCTLSGKSGQVHMCASGSFDFGTCVVPQTASSACSGFVAPSAVGVAILFIISLFVF